LTETGDSNFDKNNDYHVIDVRILIKEQTIEDVFEKIQQWIRKPRIFTQYEINEIEKSSHLNVAFFEKGDPYETGDIKYFDFILSSNSEGVFVDVSLNSLSKVELDKKMYWPDIVLELAYYLDAEIDEELKRRLFPKDIISNRRRELFTGAFWLYILVIFLFSGALLHDSLFRIQFGVLSIIYLIIVGMMNKSLEFKST
jgi:hypothetical protein